MKKMLIKKENAVYYFENGKKIYGVPNWITGYVGNIRGDVSDIRGDVFGIYGNVSGIRGDVSGIQGNLDDCEITEEERKMGININDLIK